MQPATMLGIGFVIFAGTIAATYIPWGNAWAEIWHMPEGMGALLGSFFGLIGVAISALIGFQTLKAGQAHAASLARGEEKERRELGGEVVSSSDLRRTAGSQGVA
jgi:hypothetical protein